jgi:hypothetical protein
MPGRSSAAISVTGNGWRLTCNGWSLASSRCYSLYIQSIDEPNQAHGVLLDAQRGRLDGHAEV